jgi:hypothetical protein
LRFALRFGDETLGDKLGVEMVGDQARGIGQLVAAGEEGVPVFHLRLGAQIVQVIHHTPDARGLGLLRQLAQPLQHFDVIPALRTIRQELHVRLQRRTQFLAHLFQRVGRQAHLRAERPFFLEVQIAPGIRDGFGDFTEDALVAVGFGEIVLDLQGERLLDQQVIAQIGINHHRQQLEERVVAQPLDEQDPVFLFHLQFQLRKQQIDLDLFADEMPRLAKVGGDGKAMLAARKIPRMAQAATSLGSRRRILAMGRRATIAGFEGWFAQMNAGRRSAVTTISAHK